MARTIRSQFLGGLSFYWSYEINLASNSPSSPEYAGNASVSITQVGGIVSEVGVTESSFPPNNSQITAQTDLSLAADIEPSPTRSYSASLTGRLDGGSISVTIDASAAVTTAGSVTGLIIARAQIFKVGAATPFGALVLDEEVSVSAASINSASDQFTITLDSSTPTI